MEQYVFTEGAENEKYGEFAAALCTNGNGYFTVIWFRIQKYNIIYFIMVSELSFSSTSDAKIAPIIVGGAIFVGRAVIGGAIGAAASWGATNLLNKRFPARR
jgi:hypothetical protein